MQHVCFKMFLNCFYKILEKNRFFRVNSCVDNLNAPFKKGFFMRIVLLAVLCMACIADAKPKVATKSTSVSSVVESVQKSLQSALTYIQDNAQSIGYGSIGGVTLGALITKLLEPALDDLDDVSANVVRAVLLGGTGATAYYNQDHPAMQEITKTPTAVSAIAGLAAWYLVISEGLGASA